MGKDPPTNDSIHNPETWVDLYGNYLYRFALSRVKDPVIAEDLVQETLLAALRGRKSFKSKSAVQTWLTAILKHKIIDHYRKGNRENPVEDIEAAADAVESYFNTTGEWKIRPGKWDVNPMKIYEQQEFMDVLYRCLSDLPERLAKAFELREMEGFTTDELCKTMEISATNSWVMLYRARTYLRRCLEINWFDETGLNKR